MVVHGAGGLDELTPTGENLVAEVRDGEVHMSTLDPRPLAPIRCPAARTTCGCGGDPAQNAAIITTGVRRRARAAPRCGDPERRRRAGRGRRRAETSRRASSRPSRRSTRAPRARTLDALRRVHPGARAGAGMRATWSACRRHPPRRPRADARLRQRARRRASVAVIAEVKRSSPSEGAIAPGADVPRRRGATSRAAPAACRCCAPSATSAARSATSPPAARAISSRRWPRTSPSSPSRSPGSGWQARTRCW